MTGSPEDAPAMANRDGRSLPPEEYLRILEERMKISPIKDDFPICMHLLTAAIEKMKKIMERSGKTHMCLFGRTISTYSKECRAIEEMKKNMERISGKIYMCLFGRTISTTSKDHKKKKTCVSTLFRALKSGFLFSIPPAVSDGLNSEAPQLQVKNGRLCWTPELHHRFLLAIEHLGGHQMATPKRIRELMNVKGLTCNHVRSHLQKYRQIVPKKVDASNTVLPSDNSFQSNLQLGNGKEFSFAASPGNDRQEEYEKSKIHGCENMGIYWKY
ncbi:hypothetical protein Cni_G22795 [Canna indica]|uniref:HTH myb-type domain-containing protein n=1 Tax=Canna indica TaxID=4628 RepID=A0AAQ3KT86_9LILI|nr:hypothetical protein Cni_G22795 [Canna indica]